MTTYSSPEAAVLSDITLAVFRVNGRLLERGDRLVKPLGLTSARWQVLGAIALAGKAISAPQVADAMGITRQGVQKQLQVLSDAGFIERRQNPRHVRSPLYAMTKQGERIYSKVMARQAIWMKQLSAGLPLRDLSKTLQMLEGVYERLDSPVPK